MVCEMVESQQLATDGVESQFDPAVLKAVGAHVTMGGFFGLSKLGDIFFASLRPEKIFLRTPAAEETKNERSLQKPHFPASHSQEDQRTASTQEPRAFF
jgi:hypothetical protein